MNDTANTRILAIIPARGGSKRVPRKNIRPLAGKPMIAWTIEAARASRHLTRVVLSTEDPEIARVASEYGCEVPFMRPPELAADDSASIDVVLHVLDNLPETFDYVVLLQPTSPLRTAEDIDACIEACLRSGASSCISVTAPCKPLEFMQWMDEQGRLHRLQGPSAPAMEGQHCMLNGAVYMASMQLLRQARSFHADDTIACFMPPERSIDVDEPHEFIMAEALLRHVSD